MISSVLMSAGIVISNRDGTVLCAVDP